MDESGHVVPTWMKKMDNMVDPLSFACWVGGNIGKDSGIRERPEGGY